MEGSALSIDARLENASICEAIAAVADVVERSWPLLFDRPLAHDHDATVLLQQPRLPQDVRLVGVLVLKRGHQQLAVERAVGALKQDHVMSAKLFRDQ